MTSTETGTLFPDTGSPQWRIESMHLLNWGGYDGYHRIDFSPGSTMISGPSGVGKSTLMDAYTALMMPSNVPFNGASNAGQGRARGGNQRNVVSYVRGKTDSVQNTSGELTDRRLRGIDARGLPCNAAAVVAVTFRHDTGARFTAARLFFVRASISSDGELGNPLRLTIDGTVDVGRLYDLFVEGLGQQGYQRKLETTFVGSKVHDTYTKFLTVAQSTLSIGRKGESDKALALLARIQAGQQEATIDDLYKKLVFEQPSTFDTAKQALDHFSELSNSYETMQRAYDQVEVLSDIQERHDRYQRAIANASDIVTLRHKDSGDTPWVLWQSSVGDAEYGAALNAAEQDLEEAEDACRRTATAFDAADRKVDELKNAIRTEGGERLDHITAELKNWSETLEHRARKEAQFQARIAHLDDVVAPANARDMSSLQLRARAFMDRHTEQLEAVTAAARKADARHADAQRAHKSVSDELDDLRTRPDSKIPAYLHQRRTELAELCGITDPRRDLPFIGELIDLHADDERWRTAAEAEMGGIGRHILYNENIRAQFVWNADRLSKGVRLRSEAVPFNASTPTTIPDPSTLAGKVQYKPGSPFIGWLEGFINTTFTHECVDTADALLIDDGRKRITAHGQTRQGRSGAHGAPLPKDYVLGFSNAERIAELETEVERLTDEVHAAHQRAEQLHSQRSTMVDHRVTWEAVLDLNWAEIDTGSARDAIDALEQERDAILAASDRIAELKRQQKQAEEDRDTASEAKAVARNQRKDLNASIAALEPLAERYASTHAALVITGSVTVTDAQQSLLDKMLGLSYTGDAHTLQEAFGKVFESITDRLADATDETFNARRALEDMFKRFKAEWDNYEWGTDIASYPNYYNHYRRLVDSDVIRHRDDFLGEVNKWTGMELGLLSSEFETERRRIIDRLHDVNAILERIPFGRDGDRLRIDPAERETPTSRHFWSSLQQFIETSSSATPMTLDVAKARYNTITQFIRQIMPADQLPRGESSQREEILDVRRHISIKAQKVDPADPDNIKGTYAEFDAKSGGEMQEMVAFIVGAALRYQLGDEQNSRPTFAPIILDEAFIKADSQFASRAVQAWITLGFQLIAGSVVDKVSAISRKVDRVILINKDTEGYSTASAFIADAPVPTS